MNKSDLVAAIAEKAEITNSRKKNYSFVSKK